MTVHPLPAEIADTSFDASFDTWTGTADVLPIRSPRRWTSIRRSWVLAGPTPEIGTTDRRAA